MDSLGRLEAFPNGDALRYADLLGLDRSRLRRMERCVLRWPGHSALWKTLVDLHLLDEDPVRVNGAAVDRRSFLAAVLERNPQPRVDALAQSPAEPGGQGVSLAVDQEAAVGGLLSRHVLCPREGVRPEKGDVERPAPGRDRLGRRGRQRQAWLSQQVVVADLDRSPAGLRSAPVNGPRALG